MKQVSMNDYFRKRGKFLTLLISVLLLTGCSLLPIPEFNIRIYNLSAPSYLNPSDSQSFSVKYTADCVEAAGNGYADARVYFSLIDTAGREYIHTDNILYLSGGENYDEIVIFDWYNEYTPLSYAPVSVVFSTGGFDLNYWEAAFIYDEVGGYWEARTY